MDARLAKLEMTRSPRFWMLLAIGETAAFGVALAYWSFQTEFPYVDGFRVLDVAARSWPEFLDGQLSARGAYRPLHLFGVKLVHDLAGGPNLAVFRTVEIGAELLLVSMCFALLPPRALASWLGFTVALCCLVGLHTSESLFASGIPFGTESLPVCILMLGSLLLLKRRRPSYVVDATASIMCGAAVLFTEAGVIVACLWLAAWWLGAARWQTAAGAVLVLALYATLRLLTNTNPFPGPFVTESGVLFQVISREEQESLFGGQAWIFYLYNTLSTLLTVLFSEPRAGIYVALDALVHETPVRTWQVINWLTSTASMLLIGSAAVIWWRAHDSEKRQLLILGLVVLLANSALGYLYLRDRIPSVAGIYYALLLGLSVETLWKRRSELQSVIAWTGTALLLIVLAVGWGHRAVGTVVLARDGAWSAKDEWTDRYDRLVSQGAKQSTLGQELRRRAVERRLTDPRNDQEWMREFFERF